MPFFFSLSLSRAQIHGLKVFYSLLCHQQYGSERFSRYSGYGGHLQFDGDYIESVERFTCFLVDACTVSHAVRFRDSAGRLKTRITAMDALMFFRGDASQFEESAVIRELNKVCALFSFCRIPPFSLSLAYFIFPVLL